MRESETEQGFSEDLEDLGAVAPPVSGDLTKEVSGNVEGWWEGSEVGGWVGLVLKEYGCCTKPCKEPERFQGVSRHCSWLGMGWVV